MIDPVTAPTQEPTETPRPNMRLRLLMAAAAALGVLAAVTAIALTASVSDPYKEWPAAGTQPPFADEQPFYANAIVAVTCRGGEAYMDQRMLVDTDASGTKNVMPDWHIEFYVRYDQRGASHCEVRWRSYEDNLQTITLQYDSTQPADETGKHWSMIGGGWSFDGLSSLTARKDSNDIAVLLINFKRYPQGPEVKLGTNGLLAPPKDFIES